MQRLVLLLLLGGLPLAAQATSHIGGSVRLEPLDRIELPPEARVWVALFRHAYDATAGGLQPLSKRQVLGVDAEQKVEGQPQAELLVEAKRQGVLGAWRYAVDDLRPGNYSVLAFASSHSRPQLDFRHRQALGFHVPTAGCTPASFSDSVCTRVVELGEKTRSVADVTMRAPHMLPRARTCKTRGARGHLRTLSGRRVLQLSGSAYERGWQHGCLLAQQVLDMLDFFVLEDMVRNVTFYETAFVPALEKAQVSQQMREGVRGLLAGMRASGLHSLRSVTLGREIRVPDILAINAYADSSAFTAQSSSAPGSACTQFVFWGADTACAEGVHGGTIAGRNMDGENDLRKLTVNNFLLHAVSPSEAGLLPFVHAMWPGFLGTSSGMNQQGLYIMENAGCNPPGPVAANSPILRDVIACILLDAKGASGHPQLGDRTGDDMSTLPSAERGRSHRSRALLESQLLAYSSQAGGACTNGCILVFAQPNTPGNQSTSPAFTPGLVYEGDRFGGSMRGAGEVRPITSTGVMASNHYWKYKADPLRPESCNGNAASFSSLWRYEAGKNKVEAWLRRKSSIPPLLGNGYSCPAHSAKVGVREMQELLQTVSHGTTEHSVIFLPNTMEVFVAVAEPNGVWDAPYGRWTRFAFSDLFSGDVEEDKEEGVVELAEITL